jgi:hypothetical protein
MTYYNTPSPNDLRHPDTDATPNVDTTPGDSTPQEPRCATNFSAAIAQYADVPESTDAEWLTYGSPTQADLD